MTFKNKTKNKDVQYILWKQRMLLSLFFCLDKYLKNVFDYHIFSLFSPSSVLSWKYLNPTPELHVDQNIGWKTDIKTVTLHIPFVRPCSSPHCTLTPTYEPHLSPGLLISSVICQGHLGDRKQQKNKCNAKKPCSRLQLCSLIQYVSTFCMFFSSLFQGEKCQRSLGR